MTEQSVLLSRKLSLEKDIGRYHRMIQSLERMLQDTEVKLSEYSKKAQSIS